MSLGRALKDQGMARAASVATENLFLARGIARSISFKYGSASADDVRRVFEIEHPNLAFGNWAGSIFKEPGWQFVRFIESTTPSRHRGIVRVWTYKNQNEGK